MRSSRGFTYIEITITAMVIAILAMIAVPNFLEAKVRGAVSRSKAELSTLTMALEDYRIDHRMYPPNREPGVPNGWDLVALTTPVPYLSALPMDIFTVVPAPPAYGRAPRPKTAGRPYLYLNALQQTDDGFKDTSGWFNGFIGAVVWGEGPDGKLSMALEKTEGRLSIYDPTNGTTSAGDILALTP